MFLVLVEINGTLTADFMIDTGAGDVMVSTDVFSTLKHAGTIKDADIIGERTYTLANGSQHLGQAFMIRSLKVGDVVVKNVRGGVISSQSGPLLLGQSFLQRFKSWSIDNATHELLLVGKEARVRPGQTAKIPPLEPAPLPLRSTETSETIGVVSNPPPTKK
jgi:clan AA aspartic protease (TIGR02281 family)